MKTAIASSPRLKAFLVATLALLFGARLVACKSDGASSTGSGTGTPVDSCAPNVGNTSGNAVAITSGQNYSARICYEGTSNWFSTTAPTGSTLFDISAGYPAGVPSGVDLDVRLFFKTNATTLTQVQELLAPAQSDAGVATIHTTIQVLQAGTYYVQVSDAHNTAFDATHSYELSVGTAADPDTHEPNDTTASAKPSDSKPGWLAYQGDLDVFSTTVAGANELLTLSIANPASAVAPIDYEITSSTAAVVAQGSAAPQATPFTTVIPVTTAGTFYVTLSSPQGTYPDRAPADGYLLSFGSTTNPDTVNNHTIAAAVCPGGGTGPCTMAYSGTAVTLPAQSAYMAVPGQRDFYRIDVASGAPLVLQAGVSAAATTSVKYAVDLLEADPNSPCSVDTDCAAINKPCKSQDDCELSHSCLQAAHYTFCSDSSVACALCEGAGVCIPNASGSGGLCALDQFLTGYTPAGGVVGASTISTAQPLFSAGAYYLNVHDASYKNFDEQNPYTLNLQMVPEPDPNDQSTSPAGRNNFYNPYPTSNSDLTPDKARAVDITAQVMGAQPVTGWISYETDEDWFSFQHPCPGGDCGLSFQWVQPGPSSVQVAFYMLNNDLSVHESFGYGGSIPTSAPVTSTFANGSCSQCSFAAASAVGPDGGGGSYTYYMRVADVGQSHWDYTPSGQYSFTVTAITPGCPGACSDAPSGVCGCYCTASMSCPAPTF